MAARLLLLTLAPLACTLTSEPAPRFRNLRLEPNELRLSWDSDITSGPWEVACRKGEESPVWAPTGHTYCTFLSLSLCHVTNFSVFLRGDPGSTAQIRFPESDPDRALAATDLRCWVHDVDVMTCRWGRGPGAPEHAQYRMFWRKAALGRDQDRECTHYDVTDPWGVRLGCRVDGVAALPTHVTVSVSGGGGASCSDISVDLQRVEVLTPPELSAACNGSEDARLRWEMRSHFHHGFQYELQINKSSHLEPEMEKTSENHFRVLIPGSASFRIRAKPQESARFSDWSPAVRLDCAPARKHVTVMAAALGALGAGLTVLVTLLLCRRHLRAKLFPQIPRVKDPRGVAETETVTWSAAPEDPEVTFVTEA
ncbi:interleukin-3 receptor subunit alpha-like isoform X2 [Arvicola amphibius]|uniref:interleukin-3 receptor subunit alpha-like isoform X2 n=1 Tax=Arvicola amphibius TaxID=1047088 RepID=UPI0018E36FA3|nr:interleukin-3 receptor subunit alpha-like isoform X2 [Arvicola amphibius]